MKLTFLGTGSAFTPDKSNYHSNMLLEDDDGKRLLIDCGSDARLSLYEKGLSYKDISAAYISHLHGDHCGGLEWLAFSTRFDPACSKPTLYISDTLVHELWTKVLAGGLGSLQGTVADLSSYFNVQAVAKNESFNWQGVELQMVQTVHVMNGFVLMPSFGLLFSLAGKKIFITTDTQFVPTQLNAYYQTADIIFHDCEITPYKSGVHPHYTDLCTLDPSIKSKMWLYHYSALPLPDAEKDGFCGFVRKGQSFTFE